MLEGLAIDEGRGGEAGNAAAAPEEQPAPALYRRVATSAASAAVDDHEIEKRVRALRDEMRLKRDLAKGSVSRVDLARGGRRGEAAARGAAARHKHVLQRRRLVQGVSVFEIEQVGREDEAEEEEEKKKEEEVAEARAAPAGGDLSTHLDMVREYMAKQAAAAAAAPGGGDDDDDEYEYDVFVLDEEADAGEAGEVEVSYEDDGGLFLETDAPDSDYDSDDSNHEDYYGAQYPDEEDYSDEDAREVYGMMGRGGGGGDDDGVGDGDGSDDGGVGDHFSYGYSVPRVNGRVVLGGIGASYAVDDDVAREIDLDDDEEVMAYEAQLARARRRHADGRIRLAGEEEEEEEADDNDDNDDDDDDGYH